MTGNMITKKKDLSSSLELLQNVNNTKMKEI